MTRARILNMIFFIITYIMFGCLASCKKGKEDPLISLRSRVNRITNNWQVSTSTANWQNGSYSGNWTVSNNKMVVTYNNLTVDYYDYYFNFYIYKDYTYIIQQIYMHQDTMFNSSYYAEGTWNFLDKSDGYKNKERIVLFPLKKINKNSNQTTGNLLLFQNSGEIMEIDGLHNKELNITSNYRKNDTVFTKIQMSLSAKSD